MKNAVLTALVLLIALTGCAAQATDTPAKAAKPNVIIILADDAGYADFGCYGSTIHKTPHIDALAKDGILFTDAYVTGSVCCPSRAGLLTGRYQQRFGHEFNGPDARPMPGFTQDDLGLDPQERDIAEYMKAQGYATCVIGKWNMGLRPQFQPWNRGFDEFFGFLGGSRSYFPIKGKVNEHHVMINEQAVYPEEQITYTTDDFTNYAVDYIQRHKDTPFFIYLSHNAVHTPMDAKQSDLDQLKDIEPKSRRTNVAMTKALDDSTGRITATLKELGLEDNTFVIFFNDNGGSKANASSNGSLHGWKGSHWEGGIRVPCIMKWPAVLKAGQTYSRSVMGFDFLPTAYAAAGGSKTIGKPLDGVNLLPYLRGQKTDAPHDILFWRMGDGAAARQGKWKLVRDREIDGAFQLFDLAADPSETTDISAKNPEKLNELKTAFAEWEKELTPPKWTSGGGWIKYDIEAQLDKD